MNADSAKFKGYRCFTGDWVGFEEIKPINVIIGRNNTGKSHLLKLAELLTEKILPAGEVAFRFGGILTKDELKKGFQGNHWNIHGVHLLDSKIEWEFDQRGNLTEIFSDDLGKGLLRKNPTEEENRKENLKNVVRAPRHYLTGKQYRPLWADRDIQPETRNDILQLGADGQGATNVVSRYINSKQLDRDLIQKTLLVELNKIFEPDCAFSEIEVQSHDLDGNGQEKWEIFLGEEKKGIVALSESGSGLKTVLLVLLNLLVIPAIDKKDPERYLFALEELENNLHPALLRRLFTYLEKYAVEKKSTIFLTTHSNVALDIYGTSDHAQIIRVEHNGEYATAKTIKTHFDKFSVVSELGLKPSDLLQSNGIIWVEGPSDRLYMNRWIKLFSNGEFQEGRDYQCAFYGGSLLARIQFMPEEEAVEELVNLFRVNPNVIVVCDSDKTAAGSRVKGRVRRIRAEVLKIPRAHIWVTAAKEIENYLPGDLFAKAYSRQPVPDPDQFENFFPRKGLKNKSYIEKWLNRKTLDKMDIASLTCPLMDVGSIGNRFDLKKEVETIVARIRKWNE